VGRRILRGKMNNNKFDPTNIRKQFPCLNQEVDGNPLVFLDSAASTQKPTIVIDTLQRVYSKEYANIHRGIYHLSELATRQFEETRTKIAKFINAQSADEIIFTKGATEAINLVAHSYGCHFLKEGDEIIISQMEHHANIVPWQQIALTKGLKIKIAPITDDGELDFDAFKEMLNKKTKIVAMLHMSNALGSIVPIKKVIDEAHKVGAVVLVDACQSIVHKTIDVQELDADFLVLSGHKIYGPNGTGVLYGKYHLLEKMPPYQTGGEMIDNVDFSETTFRKPPFRFEAGTPVIAEVIAFGAAIDFVQSQDREAVASYEESLLNYLTSEINNLPSFKIIGTAKHKAGVVSFIHKQAHPHDIGTILDKCGVSVRAGHHCAQPLMKRLKISATVRASLLMYNNEDDIKALIDGLHKVNKFFG
jgi:cysteine desulfurase / selenocysteine lyase